MFDTTKVRPVNFMLVPAQTQLTARAHDDSASFVMAEPRAPGSRPNATHVVRLCRSSMSFPLLAFIINGGPLSSATRLPIVQCSPPLVPLVYPRPKAAS